MKYQLSAIRARLRGAYSLVRRGPLLSQGWFRSFDERSSVDARGNPIPWISYPALRFLEKRLFEVNSVFEFGCGNGTLWWASVAKKVISVEHDPSWLEHVLRTAPPNVKILLRDHLSNTYEAAILDAGQLHEIVIVDGRRRVQCLENSAKSLTKDGVVILDNSDRRRYAPGLRAMRTHGFKRVDFVGLAPAVNLETQTSIFYRSENILGL